MPNKVFDVVLECHRHTYANVHRGIHWLSEQTTSLYEQARRKIADFIGADDESQVIFTSGTTAAINLVAHAWGDWALQTGDEILLTLMEHHSNIVPWQQLATRKNAVVRFAGITESGHLDMEDFQQQLSPRTRLVAVSAVSNVLGTINPIDEIVRLAHASGAIVVVDAAQHVPHESIDVGQWGADFVAFSGHKMLGPSGIGVLYGDRDLLERIPPFMGGGNMISRVTTAGFDVGELPAKFEAGTPPIVGAIGLGAAVEYLSAVNLECIAAHERELTMAAYDLLSEIDGLSILGPHPSEKTGIISFVVAGLSAQDIAIFLDRQGVAVRAGHHCAMPLHDHLGIRSSCRASFYLYNTIDDVHRFVDALRPVVLKLRGG
jgi:cysteine desulfurase/selenocysteine lyase